MLKVKNCLIIILCCVGNVYAQSFGNGQYVQTAQTWQSGDRGQGSSGQRANSISDQQFANLSIENKKKLIIAEYNYVKVLGNLVVRYERQQVSFNVNPLNRLNRLSKFIKNLASNGIFALFIQKGVGSACLGTAWAVGCGKDRGADCFAAGYKGEWQGSKCHIIKGVNAISSKAGQCGPLFGGVGVGSVTFSNYASASEECATAFNKKVDDAIKGASSGNNAVQDLEGLQMGLKEAIRLSSEFTGLYCFSNSIRDNCNSYFGGDTTSLKQFCEVSNTLKGKLDTAKKVAESAAKNAAKNAAKTNECLGNTALAQARAQKIIAESGININNCNELFNLLKSPTFPQSIFKDSLYKNLGPVDLTSVDKKCENPVKTAFNRCNAFLASAQFPGEDSNSQALWEEQNSNPDKTITGRAPILDVSTFSITANGKAANDPMAGALGQSMQALSARSDTLKCKFLPYTQDFKACKEFLQGYDIAYFSRKVIDKVSGAKSVGSFKACMSRVTANQYANTNQNMTQATLNCQKESKRLEATNAKQRGVMAAIKAGGLYTIYSTMPTWQNIQAKCINKLTSNNKFLLPRSPSPQKICSTVTNPARGTMSADVAAILANHDQISKMKGIMAMAGVESAGHLAVGSMLDSQAGQIGTVANAIGAAAPAGNAVTQATAMLTACQANPNTAGCPQAMGATTNAWGGMNTAGNIGTGNTAGGPGFALAPAGPNQLGAQVPNNNANQPNNALGNTLGNINTRSSPAGGINAPPAGSMMNSKSGKGGGAGGGGGGVGSTAAGVDNNPQGRGGSSNSAGGGSYHSSKYGYKGSSKGSLSYGGGKGIRSRGRKTASDPFSSMFKKSHGKKGKRILNYNTPKGAIGSKDTSIFSIISHGYQVVQGQNRLLKYQILTN